MRSAIPDRLSVERKIVRWPLVLPAFLCAFVAAPGAAQNPPIAAPIPTLGTSQMDTTVPDLGRLRPFDLIILTVYQRQDLSGRFTIDARGMVDLPGLGSVPVAGLQVVELKSRLTQALEDILINPLFSVEVQIQVYIQGEVNAPKLYPIPPGTPLLASIVLAGGETPRADLRKTRVLREGQIYVVDLEAARIGGYQGRYKLLSNDYVIVPRKTGFTAERVAFVMSGITAALGLFNLIVALK